MNQYEAMFLFDPTFATSQENCEGEIQRIMGRAEAQIDFCKKWDERRLTYKIKGRKRGTYVLVYFKAPTEKLAGIERDAHLSENILRILILRADGMTPELMEAAATPRALEADGDMGEGEGGDRRPRRGDRDSMGGGGDRPRRRSSSGEGERQAESVATD